MQLTTWNLNGASTVRNSLPGSTCSDWGGLLGQLGDGVLTQEVKLTRAKATAKERDILEPRGYAAFVDLHPNIGYAGVATYISHNLCTPITAERGVTGTLENARRADEPIIGAFPLQAASAAVDREGRVVLVDLGLFVLVNLYAPWATEGKEERADYKIEHARAVVDRAKQLVREGRNVILGGDLNVALSPHDLKRDEAGNVVDRKWAEMQPARAVWLELLDADVGFVDAMRQGENAEARLSTCANWDARLDAWLVSPGCIRWVKATHILRNFGGSDHFPVALELHDELSDGEGGVLRLRDLLQDNCWMPESATSNWPEFRRQPQIRQAAVQGARLAAQQRSDAAAAAAAAKPKQVKKPLQTSLVSFFGSSSSSVAEASSAAAANAPPIDPRQYSITTQQSKAAWSALMSKPEGTRAPLCRSHREPCKQWSVNEGPNEGKLFWNCARPRQDGSAYKSQRQCDSFMWVDKWEKQCRESRKQQQPS